MLSAARSPVHHAWTCPHRRKQATPSLLFYSSLSLVSFFYFPLLHFPEVFIVLQGERHIQAGYQEEVLHQRMVAWHRPPGQWSWPHAAGFLKYMENTLSYLVSFLGSAVGSQELDSVILVGSFQLWIFCSDLRKVLHNSKEKLIAE